jgi:F-box and WD-40 domain protein 1/11
LFNLDLELAYALIRSLPTRRIAAIVEELNPLLHIDPVTILPYEITAQVFASLDVPTLLSISNLSKSWRVRGSDPWLWKRLFLAQGWRANTHQIIHFEQAQKDREVEKQRRERKSRARPHDSSDDVISSSPKKRHCVDQDTNMTWSQQHDVPEADDDYDDDRMEDVINDDSVSTTSTTPQDSSSLWPPVKSSLLLAEPGSPPRMNWQYIYKQKRRLEKNWQLGRYTNFQLPHPSYPHEAHAECVYTIQYSGKHLVSGSRDQSLRIWNLDTQRLVGKPLRAHNASVLCLQFDPSPEQDVIISGGSDCTVIVWQFSTGKPLQQIVKAHSESVLNLRFDDRYLVTCSKDRTIKVWNRRALLPKDDAYPVKNGNVSTAYFPDYILSKMDLVATKNVKPLQPYTHLMTLYGHTAAVNAIQILGDQIVSASGDRFIKMWDIKTGECLRTIQGHTKGIACVQFDGRRIVSGSSDETIRIYDATTGAEVAVLKGHNDLVRTVQASFVDTPEHQVDDDEAEAKVNDRFVLSHMNNNSSKDDLSGGFNYSYGAKIPPGGGGSKWARIVSGSYDEAIIIWQRDLEGRWVPAHRLTQWEGILAAGGQPRYIPTSPHMMLLSGHAQRVGMQLRQIRSSIQNATNSLGAFAQALQASVQATNTPQNGNAAAAAAEDTTTVINPAIPDARIPNAQAIADTFALIQSIPGIESDNNPLGQVLRQHFQQLGLTWPPSSNSNMAHPQTQAQAQAPPPLVQHQQQHQRRPIQARNRRPPQDDPMENQAGPSTGPQPVAVTQRPLPAAPVTAAAAATANIPPQPNRRHHHQRGQAAADRNPINNRVYKLQFDSRRIICCSQDPTIVGWDFANGDKEIEIASEFFGEES